jgi:hypothetical protein
MRSGALARVCELRFRAVTPPDTGTGLTLPECAPFHARRAAIDHTGRPEADTEIEKRLQCIMIATALVRALVSVRSKLAMAFQRHIPGGAE